MNKPTCAAYLSLGLLVAGGFGSMHVGRAVVLRSRFTPEDLLPGLWNAYLRSYWERETGRTLDPERKDTTTSEGQSYTMLRAVWMNDRQIFDKTWDWTRKSLQHPSDHLFGWLWGRRTDGTYGTLLDRGGQNAASDADTDIAFALILAYSRWRDPLYLAQAREIIADIWENEVVTVKGVPVMTAGDLEKDSPTKLVINPSYLAPYAYRYFAKVDIEHDWNALVHSSYDLIDRSSRAPLDRATSVGLPPNWFWIDRKTGEILPPKFEDQNTHYGYDALRTPWRLAVDWTWNREPRAQQTLRRFEFLRSEWKRNARLAGQYGHDGVALQTSESWAMYASLLSLLSAVEPAEAEELFRTKALALSDPVWRTIPDLNYYSHNWIWFATALHLKRLPDLARIVEVWETGI